MQQGFEVAVDFTFDRIDKPLGDLIRDVALYASSYSLGLKDTSATIAVYGENGKQWYTLFTYPHGSLFWRECFLKGYGPRMLDYLFDEYCAFKNPRVPKEPGACWTAGDGVWRIDRDWMISYLMTDIPDGWQYQLVSACNDMGFEVVDLQFDMSTPTSPSISMRLDSPYDDFIGLSREEQRFGKFSALVRSGIPERIPKWGVECLSYTDPVFTDIVI